MPTPTIHLGPAPAALEASPPHPVTMERLAGLALLVLGAAIAGSAGLLGGVLMLMRDRPSVLAAVIAISTILLLRRSARSSRTATGGFRKA